MRSEEVALGAGAIVEVLCRCRQWSSRLRADVVDAELAEELELRPERRLDRQRCDRRLRAEDRAHVAHARLVQYVEASNSLLKQ